MNSIVALHTVKLCISSWKVTAFFLCFLGLNSCRTDSTTNRRIDQKNATQLLKGNSSFDVNLDLNLLPEAQLEHFRSQVDISLCNGTTPLNVTVVWQDKKIETLLMTEWFCIDSSNLIDGPIPPCFLLRSKTIIIDSTHQILLDGHEVPLDSLTDRIAVISKDFFWNNSFKFVAYEILWNTKTDNKTKFDVVQQTVEGYLKAANEIAMTEYHAELQELDSLQLSELKRKFKFTLLIAKELPPPPPPLPAYDVPQNQTVSEIN